MKNEDNKFIFQKTKTEENNNKDKIFLSKKHFMSNDLDFDKFDEDLSISDIVNNEENSKIRKFSKNSKEDFGKDFSEDLDNFNENEESSNIRKISVESIQNDFNNNIDKKKLKKKLTKEDLNNIPLPVFDCIYCTNDKIVFRTFINNILSEKYLLLTSIYDMNDLTKLISYQPLIDKNNKNEKLLNIIIKNTEYIKEYFTKEKNKLYFKSNIFDNLCKKYKIDNYKLFKQKIEDNIVHKKRDFYFRGINKIPKISINKKCLSNSTNSLINNFNSLSGLVDSVPQNIINNNIKNTYTFASCSNNSLNFNSLSLNNNEFGINSNYKENNNILDYIVENIEKKDESINYVEDKDEIMDFFKFDLTRKITKNDIIWNNKYYDIWNPEISSDLEEENEENDKNYFEELKKNKKLKNDSKDYENNNIIFNKSMGYNKYNIDKQNNIINEFNINKEKKYELNENFLCNNNRLNNNNKSYNYNNYITEKFIKISNKEDILKKYLKNSNKDSSYFNSNKSLGLNIFLNNSINNKKFFSNKKNGSSYYKSFCSYSTNNSYNINKTTTLFNKSISKYLTSKPKKQKNLLQYNSNTQKKNNLNNYSIGVSIHSKINNSTKSNNNNNHWIKYSNTFTYLSNKNNMNYNYNNKILKTNPNINDFKKNKIYNYFRDMNLLNLENNKYKTNSKYKKKLIKNNCKSQNKVINYNNYIQPNFLYSKEDSHVICNTSNNMNNKNNLSKSNILFSSNSFLRTHKNTSLYNKSLIHNLSSNKNNLNNISNSFLSNSIIFNNRSNSNILKINLSQNKINNYNSNTCESKNKYNKLKYLNNYNNDLIFSDNKSKDILCTNKNLNDLKNKSKNFFNLTSYFIKCKYKKSKKKYLNK